MVFYLVVWSIVLVPLTVPLYCIWDLERKNKNRNYTDMGDEL